MEEMKLGTYTNLEALLDAELDDAIISAGSHKHIPDLTDPPFLLPATYPGLKGPRRTPRGISGVPADAQEGDRFKSPFACPKCGGTARLVYNGHDGLRSRCLPCKRKGELNSQRARRARLRKANSHRTNEDA